MTAELPILPHRDDENVPWCQEKCPHHDGKRCDLIGRRPGAICHPAIIEMVNGWVPGDESPKRDVGQELRRLRDRVAEQDDLLDRCGEKITELQERCNQLLVQSRGVRYQVDEFHEKFGQPRPRRPVGQCDEDMMRLRLRLIAEEFVEVVEAALDLSEDQVQPLRGKLGRIIDNAPVRVDLPEFVDGLADLDYVVEGTRIAIGVDGRPIAAEVHRANMTKVGGPTRADGKIMKPEGWQPPDIEGELRKQGWRG